MTSDQSTEQTRAMRRTIGRDLADGGYVEIRAELRDDSGTLSPGFAITLDGWERHGTWNGRACARNGRDIDYGGCAHDVILSVAPDLAPIVTVHLADPDGTPMHAVANGYYFYSGAGHDYELRNLNGQEYIDRMGTDHDRAARALHIAPADLPTGLDRDGFAEFCESLRPVWAEQARAAVAVMEAMTDRDGCATLTSD